MTVIKTQIKATKWRNHQHWVSEAQPNEGNKNTNQSHEVAQSSALVSEAQPNEIITRRWKATKWRDHQHWV